MCRLFGFRAQSPSAVHRALLLETNALRRQSVEHPDGWGLAFWVGGKAEVARGVARAFDDGEFEELCNFVTADTVIAHVRKASVGGLSLENTHPFVAGPWVFAHNGTVPRFAEIRGDVGSRLDAPTRDQLRGDTDSERLFALFLTFLAERRDPLDPAVTLDDAFGALEDALGLVEEKCTGFETAPALNVVVSNGRMLAAHRTGRGMHFSTHKKRCPERATCQAFAPRCESPVGDGERVSHLIVASEPIGTVDVWQDVPERTFVGVDDAMRLRLRPRVSSASAPRKFA